MERSGINVAATIIVDTTVITVIDGMEENEMETEINPKQQQKKHENQQTFKIQSWIVLKIKTTIALSSYFCTRDVASIK